MNLFEELEWRGLVHSATEGAKKALETPVTVYIGFDPTAKSLHVGSLLPLTMLARLQRAGHRAIALVGGGTGMIGDPSGKSAERQLQTPEMVAENVKGIREQIGRFVRFDGENPARLVDNGDWLNEVRLVDFLREVGKHFTVNYMLAKESVKRRIETGISFTEFTYMLMQAADYLELHRRFGVTMQFGGSDQWGNITAGCDLLKSKLGVAGQGVVFPLVTSKSGVKFGKTESGAVWLDAGLTSPYRFYQFWLNTEDADVIARLKLFTLLPREEIESLEQAHAAAPHERAAHQKLAETMTRWTHGESGLEAARKGTRALFDNDFDALSLTELREVLDFVPKCAIDRGTVERGEFTAIEALKRSGNAKSNGEARRLIEGGGIYVNSERIGSVDAVIRIDQFKEGAVCVLRKGKKSYHLIEIDGHGG